MSEGVGDFFSRPNGESRLPDAAGPGQCKKENIRAPQQRLEGGDLMFPSDERSQEPRQRGPRISMCDEVNHLGRWDGGTFSRRRGCHGLHQDPKDRTEFGIVRIACVAVK
jgi:hypothetical protein